MVLTGGSTRIPKVLQEMQRIFKDKDLYKVDDPDHIAAYGAAAIEFDKISKSQPESITQHAFVN